MLHSVTQTQTLLHYGSSNNQSINQRIQPKLLLTSYYSFLITVSVKDDLQTPSSNFHERAKKDMHKTITYS